MRVQISLSEQTWRRLCEIASVEKRYPRQQIELLLEKALRELEQTTEREAQRCNN